MDALKIEPTPRRTAFTKAVNHLQEIIENDPVDMNAVETAFEQLKVKSAKFKRVEDAVLELMIGVKLSDVKCIICNKRHYAVLCSKLPLRSGLETESASVENSTTASSSSSNVLANQACTSEVLLQTLVVVLQNGNHKSLVNFN
ncbi:hypothetical protein TNIN_409331 [Trichonephila inaurata madagascariensis]|uniref:Uncharacterized protein n=1 Tax=Trichonephila inaurata madagascariensis TaxID=2747483 RepID=A0A8X7CIR2_9ARAC|nr:hypothetical protein TNIN_409331 [Trichonephila inaurata madagascariensis]